MLSIGTILGMDFIALHFEWCKSTKRADCLVSAMDGGPHLDSTLQQITTAVTATFGITVRWVDWCS